MMNTNNPITTAILRGLYLAVGSGLAVFLSVMQTTDDTKAAAIAGGLSALFALGFRGGVEGTFDQHRNAIGDVKGSDVSR